MKGNTPYQSSSDKEYDREREESLTEQEIAVVRALKAHTGECIINKNPAQLRRELRCTAGELRSSLHRLEKKGLVKVVGEGSTHHYKLTRAGERLN